MQCNECGEKDFDKLKVIKNEKRMFENPYTYEQWESTLITIRCMSCGYEFEEEV